jgi:hypothetical protein
VFAAILVVTETAVLGPDSKAEDTEYGQQSDAVAVTNQELALADHAVP